VARVADDQSVHVHDVELSGRVLRVTIESPDGISLDRCAEFSKALSAELDYRDLMPGKYFLEVSSPGVERRLRRASDFVGAVGSQLKLTTRGGQVEGRLSTADENGIAVELPPTRGSAETRWIPYGDIKRARVCVSDNELFARGGDQRQSTTRKDEQGHRQPDRTDRAHPQR
jgi:ribosome maturation factor RimP